MESSKSSENWEKVDFKVLSRGYENIVNWNMTNICNYRCEYCTCTDEFRSIPSKEVGKYSIDHIERSFSAEGRRWMIFFNGGEPFLYPEFNKLARSLTQNHHISMNTNLSSEKVYEFGETISAGKVVLIHTAFHLVELLKQKDGIKKYVDKYLFLQEKGFNIVLVYVTYPPFFDRLEDDFSYFREQGILMTSTKAFTGYYNNLLYPDSYTEKEKELITRYSNFTTVDELAKSRISYYGRYCEAGKRFFVMDPSGNLKRCAATVKQYGNLFEGSFNPEKTSKPCPAEECTCPYQGEAFALKRKSSYLKLKFELYQEKKQRRKTDKQD